MITEEIRLGRGTGGSAIRDGGGTRGGGSIGGEIKRN